MSTNSLLIGKSIPLNVITSEAVHALLEVTPIYEYDSNSRRTDKLLGHSYTVANLDTFDRYKVKVLGKSPLITSEELKLRRESGEKIFVEFDNAIIKMYWSRDQKSYADTISAQDIHFVETVN